MFSAVSPKVLATSDYYVVYLMVAYDEEFTLKAARTYAYTPEALAKLLIMSAFYYFYEELNIYYYIVAFTSWDSDDAVTNATKMREEATVETGFVSGMCIDRIPVHVLVAFTDQDIAGGYGISSEERGVVLVEETYLPIIGQATENVLQHEISHLYGAAPTATSHHWVDGLMCVMNAYPYYIIPGVYCEPTALVTNIW